MIPVSSPVGYGKRSHHQQIRDCRTDALWQFKRLIIEYSSDVKSHVMYHNTMGMMSGLISNMPIGDIMGSLWYMPLIR